MKRLVWALPVLLLAAAWIARDALRTPASIDVQPHSHAGAAVPALERLRAPDAISAEAGALVDVGRHRAEAALDVVHPRVRGVLRDLRTNKPVPEVRLALERGSEIEILTTNVRGEFESKREYAPGALWIDPTPFADDDVDWYSLAVGERREVQVGPGRESHFEVVVDAPAFVLLDGVVRDLRPRGATRATLLLPGAELPGPAGSSWVSHSSRRNTLYAKELSDGAQLVVLEAFTSADLTTNSRGGGPARIEITGPWFSAEWHSTGALQLHDGRILTERVRVEERSDCGAMFVEVDDVHGNGLRTSSMSIVVRTRSPLPRPDLPAIVRSEKDWALRFDIPAGHRLDLDLDGHLPGLWASGPLPVASYELEVQHPRYEIARQVVQLERGRTQTVEVELTPTEVGPALRLSATWRALDAPCPAVKWKLTRLAADGTPYRLGYTSSRLGESAGGELTVEQPSAELEGLPAAKYEVNLFPTYVGEVPCFPIPITPEAPVLDAETPVEVVVENTLLRRWRIEVAPERSDESWARGTKEFSLELFASDGASFGSLTCWLEEGAVSLYAPVDGVARYTFSERGLSSSGRVFRGAWRPWREQGGGSERERVLLLR